MRSFLFSLKFFVLMTVLCSKAFGVRKVDVGVCAFEYAYVHIHNPSTFTQTVTIDVNANGTGWSVAGGGTAMGATNGTCLSATHCTNRPATKTLAPGRSLIVGFRTFVSNLNSGGITASISVDEDDGYLTGTLNCQYASSGPLYIQVPILGGRPF